MGKKTPVVDHLNKEFESITEMCNHYNIEPRLYCGRISRGYTTGEALGQIKKRRKPKHSLEELSKIYNIPIETIEEYSKDGPLSPDQLKRLSEGRLCMDHLGKIYKSFSAMCRAYGKNAFTVRYRMESGMDLKEALETESQKSNKKNANALDIINNTYIF